MTQQTNDGVDSDRGDGTPTSEVMRVARTASGTVEIDVRAGFESVAREALDAALLAYRESATADELEAQALCAVAEQSLDLVQQTLCRIESL